ncbi:MAG: SMI1/KNR4 family protein [Thermoanaerobaculia bacterium]|nr:SMI1/KNR4 family protein [Thermoanaerobaculia bacterium]
METSERLKTIDEQLAVLRRLDPDLTGFGAAKHSYRLNPVASEEAVAAFESTHGVGLPSGYRAFVTRLGNGGAGPWYGLEPLENGTYDDLDSKSGPIDLGAPFPHQKAWNMDLQIEGDERYESIEDEYFDPKWVCGLIRIANYGCGISLNLVVNGDEYGNVWVDDRCNDGGIYPDPFFHREERTDFLTWYELWLDLAVQDLEKRHASGRV